jgi:hypothetical protein
MEVELMARPERLELPTYWFEASRSIRLSYGRANAIICRIPVKPDGTRTLPEQNQPDMFPNRFLRSKTLAHA